jgi:serine/threonine protein kinase
MGWQESSPMATAKGPWKPEGVTLFSHGAVSYEFLRMLETTNHGESVMLAQLRTHAGPGDRVVVRALSPTSDRYKPETLARMRARLEEETRLASYLEHPNIARILGRHEVQGVLYVVSEFVPGPSLRTLITAAMMRGVRMSEAFALYVGAEVASALHHAHTRTDAQGRPLGIVHRDVNPARIRLRPSGRVTLTDFALARSLLPGRVATSLPRPQGDAYYGSPEALLGEELDARADLFALGVVMLELTAWRGLYDTANARASDLEAALTPDVRQKVLAAQGTALAAELPDAVDDYILRAATFSPRDVEEITEKLAPPLRSILRALLQRRPEARYTSAAALEAELRAGLAALGAPYGAAEACDEARRAVAVARLHKDEFGPVSGGDSAARKLSAHHILTEQSGT